MGIIMCQWFYNFIIIYSKKVTDWNFKNIFVLVLMKVNYISLNAFLAKYDDTACIMIQHIFRPTY